MKRLTPKEQEQERKMYDTWFARWEREREDDENLDTFTSRINHLDKMTLMYNMALMHEGNNEASVVREQALARYNHYKDLYDKRQYE